MITPKVPEGTSLDIIRAVMKEQKTNLVQIGNTRLTKHYRCIKHQMYYPLDGKCPIQEGHEGFFKRLRKRLWK